MGTQAGSNIRRERVRQRRTQSLGSTRGRFWAWLTSLPVLAGVGFAVLTGVVAWYGPASIPYTVGQRIEQPIYAQVNFAVPDPQQTRADRIAARAGVPSYYTLNNPALCFDRIRADLMLLRQMAVDSATPEAFAAAMKEKGWPVPGPALYSQLRELGDEDGGSRYAELVEQTPLEQEYVVRDLSREEREPKSAAKYIVLEKPGPDGQTEAQQIKRTDLVSQSGDKTLARTAVALASRFPYYELRETAQAIILATLREQPTVVYNQERTTAMMQLAEEQTPDAQIHVRRGDIFIQPHPAGEAVGLTTVEYEYLRAHHEALQAYLGQSTPEAVALRRTQLLEHVGYLTIVVLLAWGLVVFTYVAHPHVLRSRGELLSLFGLVLGTLVAVRVLDVKWPQNPELVFAPCLLTAATLAIVHRPSFAAGAMGIVALLVAVVVRADLALLLGLLAGAVVCVAQLGDIRSRTKLITAGLVTALAVAVVCAAGVLWGGQSLDFVGQHALWAASCALLAAFLVSGLLPFIERAFGIATSMTLLEWSDSRRPLLQLLAREAPGTYQHSLVLGTLAEAGCEAIGANGLLAQVGALYHDIGKIPKNQYFVENQEGRINRHDTLAPTMSLLIILGHVKDGLEMAKQYKLPRVLHQFIAEHHGTTVVRYFHHVASEKQPQIASGKHDREVPETEFRYRGPKPRSRESAIFMICDGAEGAVRALSEPTVGRIEHVVHQIVQTRLNDGQFDNCEITLREIRLVEEALVNALRRHYHGRVAYPKKAEEKAEESVPVPAQEHVG